jgi:tetratricopeptide (TPR) repeat protein
MVQLAVEATRCEAHQLAQMLGVGLPAPHISRTEGHFQATLRVLDPATGKELAAQALRAEAYKDNQSVTGAPEYPSQGEVKSATLARAVADAQRLYRPWTETREIAFLDDKECNLKEAFDQLKAGDREAAMRAARASADTCPAGSKAAAGAQYNLGVLLMGERKYEQALAAFAQSQKLGGRKFVAEIASECQHDKELADAAKPPLPFLPKEAGQTGIVMTNEFVVKLVQANVDEGEIVKMIAAQPAKFALKPGDLLKLKDAGVPDEIVGAMLNKK